MKTKAILITLLFSSIQLISCSDSYFLTPEKSTLVGKLKIEGEFCTTTAKTLSNPAKVLFLIDNSGSTGSTDPENLRRAGVNEVIDAYYSNTNISYDISGFNSSASDFTTGFTRNETTIDNALAQIATVPNSATHTKDAINLAKSIIDSDIQSLTPTDAAQTTYAVVLFSDGMPYDSSYPTDFEVVKSEVLAAVDNLMALETQYSVKDIQIYSALLGTEAQFADSTYWTHYGFTTAAEALAEATTLMQDIADHGDGTYSHFLDATEIDFIQILAGSLKIPFLIEKMIFNNTSMIIVNSDGAIVPVTDSDSDGLSDGQETELGTSPINKDTDGDGVSDFIEFMNGTDPSSNELDCPDVTDADGDGLNACEEVYLNTDVSDYDTDGDLMPDGLEVIRGLDPIKDDASSDNDGDGRTNFDELKLGTNPILDDHRLFDELTYEYEYIFSRIDRSGAFCYNITVSNIGIVKPVPDEAGIYANHISSNVLQKLNSTSLIEKALSTGLLTITMDETITSALDLTREMSEITFSVYKK